VPSLTFTSVASATALVATQPVWTALLSGLRGVPVGARTWTGVGLATAGAVLLAGVDLTVSSRALVGDGLALLGGLFAAAYVVVGGEVRRSVSTTTYTTLCYSTAAALLLVVCLVGRQPLSGYAAVDWLKLAGITLGAQLLGHSLFNVVLRRVSATVVSLLVLLEIPGAALIALVALGQVPPLLALPAAALLLAGLAVVIGGSRRTEPAVPVE
jgi:drug/metabolite transporter (DMT)-like permease